MPIDHILKLLALLRYQFVEIACVFLYNIQNGCLIEIINEKIHLFAVTQVVTSWIKRRYINSRCSYRCQISIKALLSCQLPGIWKVIEELMSHLLAVVKFGVFKVPFHSIEIA